MAQDTADSTGPGLERSPFGAEQGRGGPGFGIADAQQRLFRPNLLPDDVRLQKGSLQNCPSETECVGRKTEKQNGTHPKQNGTGKNGKRMNKRTGLIRQ